MAKKSDAMIKNMKKEIAENQKEIVNEENAELMKRNRALKRQIERFLFCISNAEKFLIRRPMPAELLNELFASLPMENAFDILAKMPNGLLARNIRKMLKNIEMAMRNNKWNVAQCGPKMEISGGGLVVKYLDSKCAWNCVRAQMAILKFNLNANKQSIAYFEVEIVAKHLNWGGFSFGFCTQQFPLEGNWLVDVQNSIGIWEKGGMRIDGKYNNFNNGKSGHFQAGEVVGIGIAHSPANFPTMKCFATCNGQLLGMVDLCAKFASLELFPAITMYNQNDSIRANFCAQQWKCDPLELVQNML